jgi:predicted nuclease of predicted toxin-antitoxin system
VRVLFDQGTPEPLRHLLTQHEVTTAYERGWSELKNGELLDAAETEGYAALVTTDSNLKHQQNLERRRIAIVVLSTPSWPRIQRASALVVRAIDRGSPGSYTEVAVP